MRIGKKRTAWFGGGGGGMGVAGSPRYKVNLENPKLGGDSKKLVFQKWWIGKNKELTRKSGWEAGRISRHLDAAPSSVRKEFLGSPARMGLYGKLRETGEKGLPRPDFRGGFPKPVGTWKDWGLGRKAAFTALVGATGFTVSNTVRLGMESSRRSDRLRERRKEQGNPGGLGWLRTFENKKKRGK